MNFYFTFDDNVYDAQKNPFCMFFFTTLACFIYFP